jgi:hypothetical protein
MRPSFAVAAFLALSPGLLRAQSPAPVDPQVAAVIRELQTQQAQMTENQAKIAEKLAIIAEAVRVARIYSSRGGH